jgi:hypothetical protein
MTSETTPVVEPVVTRVEVIDHIGDAFAAGPLTKPDLLALAARGGARPALLALLRRLPERLPERRFSRPHDLWTDLKDVPIDR